MSLNNTQSEFVEGVRSGRKQCDRVINELDKAPGEAYRTNAFMEMLVALDGTHRLTGDAWYRTIVERTKNESYVFDRQRIDEEGLANLRGWIDKHGAGEWVVELLVEMMFEDERPPPRTPVIIRWAMRRMYSGIHPINEHGLFVLRKWFGLRTRNGEEALEADDASLLGHINRHTKGLYRAAGFERLYSELLMGFSTVEEEGQWTLRRAARTWLNEEMGVDPEVCESDVLLMRRLNTRLGKIPTEWLHYLETETPELFAEG